MELTLAQLMSMTTSLMQGRTDYTNSELSRFVNMAADELASAVPMRSLETTLSATVAYQGSAVSIVEANLHFVHSISNLSQPANSVFRSLEPTSIQWIDSQSTFYGTPTHYATYGWAGMRVWPSADTETVLQVRAQARLGVVASSTGTFNVDPKWHPAIGYRAAAIAASERNDLEQEAVNQARYLAFVNSRPLDIESKQRQVGGFRVSLPARR